MPVYEEKDKVNGQKRYYIRLYVKDVNGEKKQITRHNKNWIGRDGKKEAEWEENKLKHNSPLLDKKESLNKQRLLITVNECFNEIIQEDILYNRNGESTRLTNCQRYNRYIKNQLGEKKITALTNNDLNNFISYMKKRTSNIRYLNAILQLFKRIYMYGCENYEIPCKIKFIQLKENRDEIVPVSLEDLLNDNTTISTKDWDLFIEYVEKNIKEVKDKKEKITLLKLALIFSCEYILLTRVGETQGMKFKNLIVDSNIYVLYEAWNKYLHKLTPLKNRKARLLYIPPKLTNLFVQLYEMLKEETNITEDDFLFGAIDIENRDIPLSRSSIDRYRADFCRGANIKYVTNHEFRHAGISNAVHKEVDASAVSDMAGHSKQIMFSTYVQTLKEANTSLVNTLNEIKIPITN